MTQTSARSRVMLAGLMAILAVGLVAGPTFAGKGRPGGGSGGTLDGPLMVYDANGNGHANYRDSVTFNVSSSASQPFVGVRCWQGSAFVLDSYVGYFEGSWFAQDFTMDSMYWNAASDATCTARLFSYDNRGRERVAATLDFAVAP